MRKFTFTLLILAVVIGISMCEEQETQNSTVDIGQAYSGLIEELLSQFNEIEKNNADLENELVENLEDETPKELKVTALNFLNSLNSKIMTSNVQIETLEKVQELVNEFLKSKNE